MAAPTNISAATAIDLGTLPASVTQTVDDAGTTYTVWYYATAVTDAVWSLFGFGDLSVYTPTTKVYLGPTGAPVLYLHLSAGANKPVQFPVSAGVTYYFEFTTNGGNPTPASLTVALEQFANETYAEGDIFIGTFTTNDDQFPAVIVSAENGDDEHVKRFVQPFADGDDGDVLKTSGLMLFERFLTDDLGLYSAAFTELASVPFAQTSGARRIRSAVDGSKWFVGRAGDGLIRTVLPSGAFGPDSWTVTATQVTGGIAANADETILYHVGPSANTSIKRYDLTNSIALSDLAAAVPNYQTKDILVMEDDTILVSYLKTSTTRDGFVRRYSTAGATINTYNFGVVVLIRLATALDSPLSFWVWTQTLTPFGFSEFHNIQLGTGTENALISYTQYEAGIYDPVATATPVRFGVDSSCPMIVLRAGTAPEPPIEFETVEDPIRWLRRSPIQASENRRITINLFRLIIEPGVSLASGDDENTDAQIMFRYSTNNGRSWSNELWRPMGRVGKWNTELDWWRLGQGQNWVLEVSGSAAVKTVLIDGVYDVDASTDAPNQ